MTEAQPRSTGRQALALLAEPLVLLLAIIGVSAPLKLLTFAGDQAVTAPAGLILPFVIPFWACLRRPSLGPTVRIVVLLADGILWPAIVAAALWLDILTAGLHQPGGALLLFLPPIGFPVAIAAVGIGALRRELRRRRGGGGSVPRERPAP